ncbi:MAG: hypothetical protein KDA79_16595 [Planctomycetaceae bacterium]|nr:hypothetical protein [Planctomycetaceae bacterium]
MTTSRAQEVAEVLFELKRAGKVATFSTIASRAGFTSGTTGRSVLTALKTVRRDWPHLQWWRAIDDKGMLPRNSEHAKKLEESGFEISDAEGKHEDQVTIVALDEHLMQWNESGDEQAAV